MNDWLDRYLIDSTAEVLASLAVGEELHDLEVDRVLSIGIDGVLRAELPVQDERWPPGSTTDGFSIDVCRRTAGDTIEVIGLCWFDFSGRQFLVRATVGLDPSRRELSGLTVEIGSVEVDERPTGRTSDRGAGRGPAPVRGDAPPLIPGGSMVLPRRDDDGRFLKAELIVRRRPHPILWRPAAELPLTTFE